MTGAQESVGWLGRVAGGGVRRAVHGALLASMWPAARSFQRAVSDADGAQRLALRRVVASLQGTLVARRHPGLVDVVDPARLRDVAPLTSYDDIAADIDAMANGAANVRTNSSLVRFERSGGSSGLQKLLPMTRHFLADMQRGLSPWLHDLYRHDARLAPTSSYWSISPIGSRARPTPGGIPVGSDDDSDYLPSALQALLRQVLVSSPALAALPDVDACRYATLRLLMARDDLGLISVWSPTFLSLLLDTLDTCADRLLDDLADGTCRIPGANAATEVVVGRLPLTALPRRAEQLRRCLRRNGRLEVADVWPHLSVVSLWRDGESARFAQSLAARLPGVVLQGKGLLATEGIITIPLSSAPAPVLCVQSHVYEFLLDDGSVLLPHEVPVGCEAEVVLSTTAGLLRYRLGDRVRVEGRLGTTPCLRFLGRTGTVSDLVGEKLSGELVTRVLDHVGSVVDRPHFALLAPVREAPLRYRLYVDGLSTAAAGRFGAAVDDALCGGHPYRYARKLGQLGPVEVVQVPGAMPRFEQWRIRRGQRAGNIKFPTLCLDDECHEALGGALTPSLGRGSEHHG